jgi:uncharacterized protein YqfA (UPF0365 family)
MIAADKAGIPLSFDRACAIDLAVKGTSKTVLSAVRTSINPAVIDCPGGGGKIDAVARDGIQLRARARVTVRTNLDRFVGGATEGNNHRTGQRGHRHLDRLGGITQGRARESRPHLEARP